MADGDAKRESRGYRVVLTGIRGILRLLVLVCLVVVLFYLGRQAYALGHEAFNETPVDIGEGRTVVVTITDDMSTYEIGRMLRAEGLLTESALAFWLQELISEYHNQIRPGVYALKTSMTTQDMFPILAQADKISDAENSTFLAPGMQTEEETAGSSSPEVTEEAEDGKTEAGTEETATEETGEETATEETGEDTAAADETAVSESAEQTEETGAQEEINEE